jgi:hypothetical protein
MEVAHYRESLYNVLLSRLDDIPIERLESLLEGLDNNLAPKEDQVESETNVSDDTSSTHSEEERVIPEKKPDNPIVYEVIPCKPVSPFVLKGTDLTVTANRRNCFDLCRSEWLRHIDTQDQNMSVFSFTRKDEWILLHERGEYTGYATKARSLPSPPNPGKRVRNPGKPGRDFNFSLYGEKKHKRPLGVYDVRRRRSAGYSRAGSPTEAIRTPLSRDFK